MGAKFHGRRRFVRGAGIMALGTIGGTAAFSGTATSSGIAAFSGTAAKRVTLLGDSIRMGYQPYVGLYSNSNAVLWGPEENTQHCVHMMANAPVWIKNRPVDILHLNSGLHDIKCIPYDGRQQLVPPDLYAAYIERIIKYIHYCWPESAVIWATTTPVDDVKAQAAHREAGDFSRYNEDVIRYNEISSGIARRLGVPINDLYAFVDSADKRMIMKEDGIHFTELGNQLLAEQVAGAIRLFTD